MDKNRPAADRVRPILQAMERSIDAARQRRLRTHEYGSKPDGMGATPTAESPSPTFGNASTPRLKARPKRPAPLGDRTASTTFRSHAG